MKISPSILAADFTELGSSCKKVLDAGAELLHFDVMDGVFVPNITFGIPVLESLSRKIDAVYDVHLMICDPLRYAGAFAKAGAGIITFHLEAESPVRETIDAIHASGCKASLCIKPATPAQAVFPYLENLDMVLVMSVEPGFGGQKFMPQAVDKIAAIRREARRRGLETEIEVDGGINNETAALCAKAGATILVAGSSVFRAPDAAQAIRELKEACR